MADYANLSDQELTALLKEGNHTAYTEIFTRYSTVLYAHAANKLRDEDDAHDVVQEVFASLWKRRFQLDAENNLRGYLFTGVRHQIFDLIRHKKVITAYEQSIQSFAVENSVITDHLIREKQFAALIEKEIAAMPPKMREIYELKRKAFLSTKEIAEKLNISEFTVSTQMKRALKVLKVKLGILVYLMYIFSR